MKHFERGDAQRLQPLWAALEDQKDATIGCAKAFWVARGNFELGDVFKDLFLAEPRSVENGAIVGAWRARSSLKERYFRSGSSDEALASKRFVSFRNVYSASSEWTRNRLAGLRIELEATRVRKQLFYRFRFSFHEGDSGPVSNGLPLDRPRFEVRLNRIADPKSGAPATFATEAAIQIYTQNRPASRFRRELRLRGLVHENTWMSGCIGADRSTREAFALLVKEFWDKNGEGRYDGLLLGVEGWSIQGFETERPTLALSLTRTYYRERFFLEAHWKARVDPTLEDPPTMTYRQWCRIDVGSRRLVPPVHILQVSVAVLLTGEKPKFVLVRHPQWREDVPSRTPTTPARAGIECHTLEEHEDPPLKALTLMQLYEEVGLRLQEQDLHFTGFGLVHIGLYDTWTPMLFGLAISPLTETEFMDAFRRGKFSGRFVEQVEFVEMDDLPRRLKAAPPEPARDAAHQLALVFLGEAEPTANVESALT